MGNLYEICYDHAIESLDIIDMKNFMYLVLGHSKFIGKLKRLLAKGEQALKNLSTGERYQKMRKIDQMNTEFLQRVLLFISQNVDKLDQYSIERLVRSMLLADKNYGKYREILVDLAAIYAGIVKNLKIPDDAKKIRLDNFSRLFRRLRLSKDTQKWAK
jgi:hypothetical protein